MIKKVGKNRIYLADYNREDIQGEKEKILKRIEKVRATHPNLKINAYLIEPKKRKDIRIFTCIHAAKTALNCIEKIKDFEGDGGKYLLIYEFIKGKRKIGDTSIFRLFQC